MIRDYHLKGRYGITTKEKDQLCRDQANRCAICGGSWTRKGPSVDHNHLTGQRRGLLCQPCNMGLGAFRENPVALRRAIHYLKAWA